jgi:hypothetical protein
MRAVETIVWPCAAACASPFFSPPLCSLNSGSGQGGGSTGELLEPHNAEERDMRRLRTGFFYQPPDFYRSGAVRVATAVYRGIPLNTARIQISNQNR